MRVAGSAEVGNGPSFAWSLGLCPPDPAAVIFTNVPVNITCTRRPTVAITVAATLKSTPELFTERATVKVVDTIITIFSVGFIDTRIAVGVAEEDAVKFKSTPEDPAVLSTVDSPTPIISETLTDMESPPGEGAAFESVRTDTSFSREAPGDAEVVTPVRTRVSVLAPVYFSGVVTEVADVEAVDRAIYFRFNASLGSFYFSAITPATPFPSKEGLCPVGAG